jgi:cobalt-zinc-cadmium efflux system membrane fusion protein
MMIRRTWARLNFRKWGPCVGILSILAGIGWWGHAYHWSFSHSSHAHEAELALVSSVDHAPKLSGRDSVSGAPSTEATSTHDAETAQTLDLNNLPTIEFSSSEAAKNCGLEIATARQQAMDEFVIAHGNVDYDQTHLAQLSVRVPGVVWRVEKRVGDVVRRDELLAIVDSADVGQAKANLLEATVLYNLKATTLERLESVKNAVPGREIAQARADQEMAKAQQLNALQRLVNLGFPINESALTNATLDGLTKYLQLLGLPSSLEAETESTNLIPLLAPFDGVVTQCHIVRGETVDPLVPQYVIANTERMWIELDVRQEDVNRLKIGTPLDFICETGAAPVSGVLTWIGTEIDTRTHTVHARGEVHNPAVEQAGLAQRRLRAGTFGSARILVEPKSAIVAIPNSALHWQWEVEREVVFIPAEDGRTFTPRVVTKGEVRDGWVHIQSGLKPHERVVSSGSRVLASELSRNLQKEVGENADAIRLFNQVIAENRTRS